MFGFDPNDKTKHQKLSTWQLLVAGALAGAPAAFSLHLLMLLKLDYKLLVKNEAKYKGILDCGASILKQEGLSAF